MAALSSIMDYYYEQMYPWLKILEEKRLQSLQKLKKTALTLFILSIFLALFLIQNTFFAPFEAILGSLALAGMIFLLLYRHEKAGYDSLFKDHVIEKLIHFIEPSLSYQKENHVSKDEYDDSGIFPSHVDRYSGSDLVQGLVDGVSITFSDLHAEEKKKGKDGKEEWHTLFQGIFFSADFHKEFKSRTYVLPDIAQRLLGGIGLWLQGMQHSHGELIKLDHIEFEQLFVVYGTNQIEARYILSHALMQRIISFYKKHRKNLYIGFVKGKMYIAIEYNKALFSPSMHQSLLKFSHIREYVELLEMLFSIVESLKLDKKLWSKY